ncbi:putative VPS10 domain-containing receptor SorCS2, partial [Scophthalmus maximus]
TFLYFPVLPFQVSLQRQFDKLSPLYLRLFYMPQLTKPNSLNHLHLFSFRPNPVKCAFLNVCSLTALKSFFQLPFILILFRNSSTEAYRHLINLDPFCIFFFSARISVPLFLGTTVINPRTHLLGHLPLCSDGFILKCYVNVITESRSAESLSVPPLRSFMSDEAICIAGSQAVKRTHDKFSKLQINTFPMVEVFAYLPQLLFCDSVARCSLDNVLWLAVSCCQTLSIFSMIQKILTFSSFLPSRFFSLFPPYFHLCLQDVQIVSTDENQVFLALQEWYQSDTYNLYQSDPQGVYYSIVLENVRSTKQPEENVLIDILEVRGIKGVFLANQKTDGKVTTLITYNKGRDWEPLAPPTTDMNGKPVSCKAPDCHLHLHLRWADNPYVSGTVHTKDSAPGLIMGAGNLGSKLVEYKEEMYITSDCGKTWRQSACRCVRGHFTPNHLMSSLKVFEEEHHILYLDHGGVIVAIKDTSIPLKILKFSIDEGRTWTVHNFTSTSVFVDGLLSEPGDETLVMTVFGHISYRSDWELVKVDFRQSFPHQCTDSDYESWQLTDLQGEKCIMGQERSFRKRKDTAFCIKGKSYTSALSTKPCQCTEKDFNCDYGFERSHKESDRCFADFWHDPDSPPEDCHLGHTYESTTGYRKVISNVCEGGLNRQQSAKQHNCPLLPPRGLQVGIKGQMLAVAPGDDITFIVHQEQGDTSNTKYQVDLGDGVRAIYQNLTVTDEPIQHRYEKPGIYKVTVKAENMAGHDRATMYIQVTAPLQEVHLEVVPIAGRNHEVNLTALVLPTEANLTVFYWWIGDNLRPTLTLQNSLLTRFPETGEVSVTVQASNGRSMVQDTRTVRVYDNFQVIPLSFSRHLDYFNPNIPEWREDIGQVVTKILAKITGVPQESLVTVVKPGLPTTADLYVLPLSSKPAKRSMFVDKRIPGIMQAFNDNNVSFVVRGGLQVLVMLADPNAGYHGAVGGPGVWALAVIFLISIIATGSFILYKFKRKLPGSRNVYAQMHNEKEQEMTSPVNHSEDTQHIIQGEEFIDDDLDSQTLVYELT